MGPRATMNHAFVDGDPQAGGVVEHMRAIQSEESLTNRVYDMIRKSIIVGELVPGSLHSVQSLADVLGVSRTPVREALIKLASQGMVRFERSRGIRILQTTIHDLEEIFSLRLLLEVPATYRATQQFTDAGLKRLRREFTAMQRAAYSEDEQKMMQHDRGFHNVILEMSGNRRLAAYVDRLRDLVLTRGVSTAGTSRSLADIVTEHEGILKHVEAGDAPGAAAAMKAHVLHTGQLLISQEGGRGEAMDLPWADLLKSE
ncbi:MAG: GntR family transcriptional regulator [Actinomycetota bacterium]